MAELLVVEQQEGSGADDGAHWILEGGRILPGVDDGRRMAELRRGLLSGPGVRAVAADAGDGELERTLAGLHEPGYLEALDGVAGDPVVLPEWVPPGLPPDIPVSAGLVEAAREGVRTAITAGARLAAGERFAYALCRPPGHHAGPAWCAGYCYLNTAAAAVQTLREAGMGPVGVLDLDLHYPNGTAAIVESMEDVFIHSLNASPVTNIAADAVEPTTDRELAVEFVGSPNAETWLAAAGTSLEELRDDDECAALVVSLGYDIVAGDPHGSWGLEPGIFAAVGRLLAAAGLPVCVVQEGGYALDTLAECAEAFAGGLLDPAAAVPSPHYAGQTNNGRVT